MIYIETIITTLSSIFKTVFWFMIILISFGWQMYKYFLSREEMKKFIGIYICIYLSVAFDQIIDNLNGGISIGIVNRIFYLIIV